MWNKKILGLTGIEFAVLIIYAVGVGNTVLHHEMWRDEAQKWLIARDLDITGIVMQTRYEGHPALWYFVLYPFAHLVFPPETVNIVHWAVMCMAVYILLRYCTLPVVLKVGFVLSFPLAYEHAVVARNYGIAIFFLFAAVALYAQRDKYPVAAIACGVLSIASHIYVAPICGMLMMSILIDRWRYISAKQWAAILIIGAIGAFFIMQIFLRPNDTSIYIGAVTKDKTDILPFFFKKLDDTVCRVFIFGAFVPRWWWLHIALAVIIMFGYRMKIFYIITFIACMICFFAANLLIYELSDYHSYFLLIFLFMLMWASYDTAMHKGVMYKIATALLATVFFISDYYGLRWHESDLRQDMCYSAGKEMAEYINTHDELYNATLVGFASFTSSALIPYLKNNKKIYYAEKAALSSYSTWSNHMYYYSPNNYSEFKQLIDKNLGFNKVYFIVDEFHYQAVPPLRKDFTIVYKNQCDNYHRLDEKYYILKAK
ncbi:MAG: hypothetical protein NW207_01600 [Cytophagales bacterium]|nr:hypothetical protein [Cytophagales bacterium]